MLVGFRRPTIAAFLLLVPLFISDVGAVEDPGAHWKESLAGTKLEQQWHASGGPTDATAKTTWHLCPDGTFRSSHSATASVEAQGSLSLSSNQVTHSGRWSVETRGQDVFLVLRQRDGRTISYRLSSDGQTTYLDGQGVIQTRSRLCS